MSESPVSGKPPAHLRSSRLVDHPVGMLLAERVAASSLPGQRTDEHTIALVIEGGGMRGVVSAAMTAALEEQGLLPAFDLAVGTSAGALNGAALTGGVARACTEAYHQTFNRSPFVSTRALLIGRPAFSVAAMLSHADDRLDAERHVRAVHSRVPLHTVATSTSSARAVAHSNFATVHELTGALLASTRMPLVGGLPVSHHGDTYLDGGLAEPLPVHTALAAGATHLLVLMTRPEAEGRTLGPRIVERAVSRWLDRHAPALVDLFHRRVVTYSDAATWVEDHARTTSRSGPQVARVRLPPGSAVPSQFATRSIDLATAAAVAHRHTVDYLTGMRADSATNR